MTILPSGIIEVETTREIAEEAHARNKAYFAKCGHVGTHRNDVNQRLTGFLHEAAVRDIFPYLSYSEDDRIDFVYSGITYDAKAQGCNVTPKPHFAATLYEEQRDREVDYLIFGRVQKDFKKIWICGFIEKVVYLEIAKLVPAGTANNNFVYDQARYEARYDQLIAPAEFLSVEVKINNQGD